MPACRAGATSPARNVFSLMMKTAGPRPEEIARLPRGRTHKQRAAAGATRQRSPWESVMTVEIRELLNVPPTLRSRYVRPIHSSLRLRAFGPSSTFVERRVEELRAAGVSVRVERPKGEPPVVCYTIH
jgi:hypothetical protein